MMRPCWLALLLCFTLLLQGTISAVASGSTTTKSEKDAKKVEAASQTKGTHTIVQPTNMFKQAQGISNSGMIRAPFKRDLRPFEWLYRHLNDYLMCAYGEHPDCETKLAKSMELEEAMSHLNTIRMQSLKQHGRNQFEPSLDAIESNVPLTSDFGFLGQSKKTVNPLDKLNEKVPMKLPSPEEFPYTENKFSDHPFAPHPGPEPKPFGAWFLPAGPVGPHGPFGAVPVGPIGPQFQPRMDWFMYGNAGKEPKREDKKLKEPRFPTYPMMPIPFFMPRQF